MAWLSVDRDGSEAIYPDEPSRKDGYWHLSSYDGVYITWIDLPKGSIKKLIGRDLAWEDEPVELK